MMPVTCRSFATSVQSIISETTAMNSVAAPTQSISRRLVVVSGIFMCLAARARSTTHSGTLMKNRYCQPRLSVMKPPRPGPTRAEPPNTTIMSPSALPRSCGGNTR